MALRSDCGAIDLHRQDDRCEPRRRASSASALNDVCVRRWRRWRLVGLGLAAISLCLVLVALLGGSLSFTADWPDESRQWRWHWRWSAQQDDWPKERARLRNQRAEAGLDPWLGDHTDALAAASSARIHLSASSAASSSSSRQPQRITVLVVTNDPSTFAQHAVSLECYARRHQYAYRVVDPATYPDCVHYHSWLFRKHCAVAQVVKESLVTAAASSSSTSSSDHAPLDAWLAVIDSDTFVVNAQRGLEEFLPATPAPSAGLAVESTVPFSSSATASSSPIHLVMYERYGEVMAGTYLIRINPWSAAFLLEWADYDRPKRFRNEDNEALHLHLLARCHGGRSSEAYRACAALPAPQTWTDYFTPFLHCFHCHFGGQRSYPAAHIHILRNYHAWVRDHTWKQLEATKTAGESVVVDHHTKVHPSDMFFHRDQTNLDHWYEHKLTLEGCSSDRAREWTPTLRRSVLAIVADSDRPASGADPAASVAATHRRLALEEIRLTQLTLPGYPAVSDVAECFPHCPRDLQPEQAERLQQAFCPSESDHLDALTRTGGAAAGGNPSTASPPAATRTIRSRIRIRIAR